MADPTRDEGYSSSPNRRKTSTLEHPVAEEVSQKAEADFLQTLRGTQEPRDSDGPAMGAPTEDDESQPAVSDETAAAKKRRKRKPRKRNKKPALQSSATDTGPQEAKAEADKNARTLPGRNDSQSSPSPFSMEQLERISPKELVDLLKRLSDRERRELRTFIYKNVTGAEKDKARQVLVADYKAKRQENAGRVSNRPTGTPSARNRDSVNWNAVRAYAETREATDAASQNRENESLERQSVRARMNQAFHQWLVAMSNITDAVNEYRETESKVHGLLKKLNDTKVQAVNSLKWLVVNGQWGKKEEQKVDEKANELSVYNPVNEVTKLAKCMGSYVERARFTRSDKYERFRAWMRKTYGFDPENIPEGFSEGDPEGDTEVNPEGDLEGDTEVEEG